MKLNKETAYEIGYDEQYAMWVVCGNCGKSSVIENYCTHCGQHITKTQPEKKCPCTKCFAGHGEECGSILSTKEEIEKGMCSYCVDGDCHD